MRRVSLVVAAAALCASVTGGCGAPTGQRAVGAPPAPSPAGARVQPPASPASTVLSSPSPSGREATQASRVGDARCQPDTLRLAVLTVSEATQQETRDLRLTNTGTTACHLFGYPGISLLTSGGAVLPLHFAWHGDQMVTSASPRLVEVAPGQSAWVRINQVACQGRPAAPPAARVLLIPPDDTAALAAATGEYPLLSYCGPGDPGSTVDVSPVEPSEMDTVPVPG